jgi:ABC-type multidrug transport system fused ATPase/permease subunit
MVSRGEILLGTVVAAQSFSVQLATPLQLIVQDVNAIASIKSIVDKIRDLTTDETPETPLTDVEIPPEETARITLAFEGVNLTADSGKKILNNFTFTFEPGKKYLILGKNGAGKSSVFKVLKRRFASFDGNIKINGEDLSRFSNASLSRRVAYLGENVSLLTGTVAENITFWRELPPETVLAAVGQSHLRLPLDREIGDEGYNISSGEQRRIEIARGLTAPVAVMIFDEIVSTLDVETAYEIEKTALSYENKTVIFISHNFSGKLVREYDDILIMENGSLVDHGDFETLKDTSAYFRRICEIKFGEVP